MVHIQLSLTGNAASNAPLLMLYFAKSYFDCHPNNRLGICLHLSMVIISLSLPQSDSEHLSQTLGTAPSLVEQCLLHLQ